METLTKPSVTASEFIGILTEWRRKRNIKYRSLKNMSHVDFICQIMANREATEADMDKVLPPEMHSSTKPLESNYNLQYL